ncbi:MAG: methyltransferase domain-containing protein [Sedimenticola sp.]
MKIIEEVSQVHDHVNIIDVGGTELYWKILPQNYLEIHNISITVVNVPGSSLPTNHGRFEFVHADGCNLSEIQDNSFHIAHSNSVIEHVGDWNRMVLFSKELKRIAPRYFIQTPNYWFPIEPHCMTPFFHWLPKPIRILLVMKFSLGNWIKASTVGGAVRKIEGARLLNRKMFCELFDDAQIETEKFAFMPKSFVALRMSTNLV